MCLSVTRSITATPFHPSLPGTRRLRTPVPKFPLSLPKVGEDFVERDFNVPSSGEGAAFSALPVGSLPTSSFLNTTNFSPVLALFDSEL